jgi:hypothetical protein
MEAMAVMEIICDKIFYSDLTAKVAKFWAKSTKDWDFITQKETNCYNYKFKITLQFSTTP